MANAAVSVLLRSIDSFHYSIRIFSLQCLKKKKNQISLCLFRWVRGCQIEIGSQNKQPRLGNRINKWINNWINKETSKHRMDVDAASRGGSDHRAHPELVQADPRPRLNPDPGRLPEGRHKFPPMQRISFIAELDLLMHTVEFPPISCLSVSVRMVIRKRRRLGNSCSRNSQ